MNIPITMCHGIPPKPSEKFPLSKEHFDRLMKIAHELGFQSINYSELAAWRSGNGTLPARPLMIDFDHPELSMRREVFEALSRYGFKGNLFINTGPIDKLYNGDLPSGSDRTVMRWEEIGELMAAGWHIGAHTVTHPNLSKLSTEDPTGEKIRAELEGCNATLKKQLGITPKDFAYTGTSFSTTAEREVSRLYRFGRLWIIGSKYQADGKEVRYADLVGVPGPDETDDGPPMAARYITKDTPAYRLPSMEIQALIHTEEAFRKYLEGALTN